MILRHRDLVAEIFGWLLRRRRSVDASRTARAQHTYIYTSNAFKRVNVYVIRTNTRAVRYPATLRRPFALVARLFGGLASYRLRRRFLSPSSPSPGLTSSSFSSLLASISLSLAIPRFSSFSYRFSNDIVFAKTSRSKEMTEFYLSIFFSLNFLTLFLLKFSR